MAGTADIWIAPETVAGVEDANFFDNAVVQRATKESLNSSITYVNSEEMRNDRQLSDIIPTNRTQDGTMDVEFSAKSFNPLLESVMGNAFSTQQAPFVPGDAVVASTTTMTSAGTAFVIAGLVKGSWVNLTLGTVEPKNNKLVQLSKTVDATTGLLTFESPVLTIAAADATLQISPSALVRLGLVDKSMTIIRKIIDSVVPTYFKQLGMRVSKFSFNFQSEAILTAVVSFLGETGSVSETAPSGVLANLTAESTTDVMDTLTSVGEVLIDGTASGACISDMTLDIDAALRERPCLGSEQGAGIAQSRFIIGGTINIYFASKVLYEKYLNSTALGLAIPIKDAAGNAYVFTMGKVKFETMTVNAEGNDTDVMLNGSYKALLDSVGTALQIDKIEV